MPYIIYLCSCILTWASEFNLLTFVRRLLIRLKGAAVDDIDDVKSNVVLLYYHIGRQYDTIYYVAIFVTKQCSIRIQFKCIQSHYPHGKIGGMINDYSYCITIDSAEYTRQCYCVNTCRQWFAFTCTPPCCCEGVLPITLTSSYHLVPMTTFAQRIKVLMLYNIKIKLHFSHCRNAI